MVILTISDEEKREAKARKEEERTKRIAEKQSGDETTRLSMPQAQPGITSEDERSAVPGSADSEPGPYLDSMSIEEPREPASKISQTEAEAIDHGSPNESTIEEQPRSVTGEVNEADAVSEVDPTLLDPALRELVIDELSMPEKSSGELLSSDSSHAELVAARVLSAPSINDVPIEEVTKTVHDATEVHQDLVKDPSHPPNATVPEQNHIRQDLVADLSHASETTKEPDETNDPPTLLPDPSDPAKVTTLDDISIHQGYVPDPLHASEAINTAPKSPKGEYRMTSWLKSKFGRRTAKTHESLIEGNNQDPVDLEDDGRHKVELGRTSQSVSSISSDEGAKKNVPVLRPRISSSHGDVEEAHNHPDIKNDSEEKVASGTSRDVGQTQDNHVRDSKFQENL